MTPFSALFAAATLFAAVANPTSPYVRTPYVGTISVNAEDGAVLSEDNADGKAYPASVTKLMTAYLVFDDIKAGKLNLSDTVVASPVKSKTDAHYRQPSCTGLRTGEKMTVDEMLKSLMVNSANDAAIFLAEKCSGDVKTFVERMNAKAEKLGMKSTKYFNPNGLPPPPNAKERHFNYSTCRDLAKMAVALLKDHPEILDYTSLKVWDVTAMGRPFLDGRTRQQIRWVNHNNVMVKDKLKVMNPDGTESVDGLKTGYINAGGSSVVITGKRKDKRVIAVVLGSASAKERDNAAADLVSDALTALVW